MKPRVVVGGSLAQKPGRGGHTWVFLQYLLGLKRLGWEVLFLDRQGPGSARATEPTEPAELTEPVESERERHPGIAYVRHVFDAFGLRDDYAILGEDGSSTIGRSRRDVLDFVRSSTLFLNVMGFIEDEEIREAAPLLAFLDIDPGFGQIWRELGLHDPFLGHDRFVTIGERIGQPGCGVPTCGLDWITTPQPVVLEHWPADVPSGDAFTSVAAWRGAMGPLEYQGRRLGLRVHEFRRFLPLPARSGQTFGLALDIHQDETEDLARLREHGWHLADPLTSAGDPWRYRDFIQRSAAEFMVAKNLYVETRAGWISDRSICYLASGRPVLAQDTGLAGRIETGLGLVTFDTLDEACDGVESINRDRVKHGRAARALAQAHFDSDLVLPRLVDAVTSSTPMAGASVS